MGSLSFDDFILDPRGLTGETQAEASLEGAKISAEAQKEQLEYLKEINKLPQQYREQALTELAGAYSGKDPSQQQGLIDRAKASPLYQEIMGGKKAGEEAIMRHAGATGGLRSGNVQENLYDYNTRLENKALTETYGQQMSGLKGLAMLPTGEKEIGDVMGGIGETLGMGSTAAANALAQGQGNTANVALGIASLFV